ncbi:hypothetical protein [Clostridium tyrobutyricum]|nr:hypothetical protein [Clostridium tyrobutyricum]
MFFTTFLLLNFLYIVKMVSVIIHISNFRRIIEGGRLKIKV